MNFLKKVFTKINGYPSRIVNKIVYDVQNKMKAENMLSHVSPGNPIINENSPVPSNATLESKEEVYNPFICLPYKGVKGEEIVKKFRNVLKRALPSNVKPRIIFKGTKLGSCFQLKDKIPIQHESNVVYEFKPSDGSDQTKGDYIGETKVRFGTRAYEHCYTDKESSVYKHKIANNINITESDFRILDKGYTRHVDRKLAEALYVKESDPILNRQKKSFTLHLFN